MLDFQFHTLEAYFNSSNEYSHPNLFIIIGMQGFGSNSIQIPSATSCNSPPAGFLILLQYSNLFKSLQYLSLYTSATFKVTSWTSPTVLTAAVEFAKSSHTDGFAEVDVSCNCCGADVEPVWIIWSKLLE
jgi:hypothetical protein